MAVERVFGAETVWHCEINDAAAKVLAHHWPSVPNHRDLISTDWRSVEPVDIFCAGWPCQPWSLAGKRKGVDDERAIWPHIARAIRILRPRHIVLENVPTVVGVGELWRVLNSLSALRYDAQWTCMGAAEAGAPHIRERFFLLAADTESASAGERLRPRGIPLESRRSSGDDSPRPAGARHSILDFGPFSERVRRWEAISDRVAPPAAEVNAVGSLVVSPAFAEWLMGWPAGWVTAVPGLTAEEQLRICGNGVVPQCAEAALRWLLSIEVAA